MKAMVKIEKEIDIRLIEITVPVRYDEEDMPNNFPKRNGNVWQITVDIDTGQILNWPGIDEDFDLYMKVTDEGTYRLFDDNGNFIAAIDEDYVPNKLIPGEYGDYIDLKISADGIIKNWPKSPCFDGFFDND